MLQRKPISYLCFHGMDHAVLQKCVFIYKMKVSMSCILQLSQYPTALG